MNPTLTIKDMAREARIFRGRVVAASVGIVLIAMVLVLRMLQLQVIEFEHFSTLSEDNRVKIVPISPTRGLIYDRNGVALAVNTPTYTLEIVPEQIGELEALLDELGELVEITAEDRRRVRENMRRKRRFESIPVRFRLSEDEVARFAVNRHRFPGADVHARLTRSYPLGGSGTHVIGYVGRLNEAELQQVDATNYRGSTHIGKTGVEQAYESELHGTVGFQQVETNAAGRTLRVLERKDPLPGSNLFLTIDASLQAVAERALGEENGAVVALDPSTGGVLALASTPVFDPNLFVDGIDSDSYRELLMSADRPLFNRAINGQYPPGSTIKPFLGLAGLELDLDGAREDTICPGFYRLPGGERRYRDWKKYGHGQTNLKKAIVESCDVFFYKLAQEMGIDRMHEFLSRFGFGMRTGIDLPGEVTGLLPSSQWKKRARGQVWFPGETLIAGIGQGYTLVTPLQLAAATATLGTRGVRLRPQVVLRRVDGANQHITELSPETLATLSPRVEVHWQEVIDAMTDVVHGERGTARRIGANAPFRMAGKTGTSQVFGIGQGEEYEEENVAKKLRDHGLFLVFSPAESPRIAVAVVVENGGSGSRSAAPVAREVLDHFFSELPPPRKKGLMLTSAPAESAPPTVRAR